MEKFLFLDLDDTVFQTARKCTSLEHASPASYNLAGEASSYFLPKQQRLLKDLSEQWRIIPTTARTLASYARVELGVSCTDGAILNHGATILCADGKEDRQWRVKTEPALKVLSPLLVQIKQVIEQYAHANDMAVLVRIGHESGMDLWVEVRHHQADYVELQSLLTQYIQPLLMEYTDFKVYLNSNCLTILPCCVNKAHAVEYCVQALEQQYGEIITMGMGDSLSDLPFMALCDYVMMPKHTQLHGHLLS